LIERADGSAELELGKINVTGGLVGGAPLKAGAPFAGPNERQRRAPGRLTSPGWLLARIMD